VLADPVRVAVEDGVARVTIDHGPLNLYDLALNERLAAVLDELEDGRRARVCVVESAAEGFFVAHYDVRSILNEPEGEERTAPGPFNVLMRRFRETPLITIGKVRGAARGGGCELLLALDMRFAARESARFALPEAWLGILAAGGGTQRLPGLVGRARALEMLLGGADLDADDAERWGLINRALPDKRLDRFVDGLARDIAAHPPASVRLAKLAVNQATTEPPALGLEALFLDDLKTRPGSRARITAFLDAGGQTPDGEQSFRALLEATRAALRAADQPRPRGAVQWQDG
jgi:enoyl-CoA hydratase/carnithine racemase